MWRYEDHVGMRWNAFIDERTRKKRGRSEFASFTVFCPLQSYRQDVKVVGSTRSLKAHTAMEVT